MAAIEVPLMDLEWVALALQEELDGLTFGPPVTHVYDPTRYAWRSHRAYLSRFGRAPREVILLGMNPGPYGMAQTGVPFGEVQTVRDWLKIEEPIERPKRPHPKRPIEGLNCQRSEVSGQRLWGWAREKFGTPERFFERFFIANYCPLCFMEESGKNFTPDKLPAKERAALFDACDRALRRQVEHLGAKVVVGVGAFAEARAKEALAGLPLRIGRILHPSPASPLANQGWAEKTSEALARLGIEA